MDKPRYLSGDELVARGITKVDGSLPELGNKDVFPSGTWLEQKQIQSALEARKDMIGVERIEKSGVISHAEWCEELMLAKVTQKTGGHWQYLGHNIGKDIYLFPEEALYLIEVNCLLLKHNEVTVSLQQAYSLLLRSKVKLLQYKVYASLSKIGYKVYRFDESKYNEQKINMISSPAKEIKRNESENESECTQKKELIINEHNQNPDPETVEMTDHNTDNIVKSEIAPENDNIDDVTKDESATMEIDHVDTSNVAVSDSCDPQDMSEECENPQKVCTVIETEDKHESSTPINQETNNVVSSTEDTLVEDVKKDSIDIGNVKEKNREIDTNTSLPSTSNINVNANEIINNNDQIKDAVPSFYFDKLQKLINRQNKHHNAQLIDKSFEIIPDLLKNPVVTVNAPEEQLLPRNVFLNNITYEIKLQDIKQTSKNTRRESAESRPFSANEEVNGDHIKRIREANVAPNNNWTSLDSRFQSQQNQFFGQRHPFWRPNTNFFPFNMLFQRPLIPSMNFQPRFRFFSRPPFPSPPPRPQLTFNQRQNFSNFRKRKRTCKRNHFEAIKSLAVRLKQLIQSGSVQTQNLQALHSLLQSFNDRYRMRLRLTENFEVINDETIVETITLDDDEESSSKRTKKSHNDTYPENFDKLQQIALKLQELQEEGKANNRHKRALSKLVHKFNKSYGADVYVNNTFKVIDKRFITLDSSSDSDCVVEENSDAVPTRKKVKNPFNILKRLSEKPLPSTNSENPKDNKYNEVVSKAFPKNWIPSEEDFGRVEVVPKQLMNYRLIDSKRNDYLLEFFNNQPYDYESWTDLKISFLRSMKETPPITDKDVAESENSEENAIKSLINPKDSSDIASVLKKLSIIKCNKEVDSECHFTIDFDVYKRDVQNFKKRNRPKPNFRLVCVSESSRPLTGKDVATLYSKYDDKVPILFAVVGRGSVSYAEISPFDLPVYISSNDLE